CPVLGTTLEGQPIQEQNISNNGLILFGNESKGLSKKLIDYCKGTFSIEGSPISSAESLNVASATAIVCHHFYPAIRSASTK
ncbi:MAG: TrmH family RNA methyltransferase, partial [Bacteroidota bacterium]